SGYRVDIVQAHELILLPAVQNFGPQPAVISQRQVGGAATGTVGVPAAGLQQVRLATAGTAPAIELQRRVADRQCPQVLEQLAVPGRYEIGKARRGPQL